MSQFLVLQTRLGEIKVEWVEGRLFQVLLGQLMQIPLTDGVRVLKGRAPNKEADALIDNLISYFSGQLVIFPTFQSIVKATPFQRLVWEIARDIPYGKTRTYGWIAQRLGQSGAVRAVGNALGKNRTLILIPCHRVVGSDGSLTGFSFGLGWKRALLELENA